MPTVRPESWQQISPYLEQILSLPEEERPVWLESFRGAAEGAQRTWKTQSAQAIPTRTTRQLAEVAIR